MRIEFNPTRPRERVRFSIAHEIAHTLFSDFAEQTRHRGGPSTTGDEWQLEMLCNLAAAEFVMPLGSLPATDSLPRIEQLIVDRRKFDVSAEAFLIRVVKTTAEPALMFCASPIEGTDGKPAYRVDYSVGSKSAPARSLLGQQSRIAALSMPARRSAKRTTRRRIGSRPPSCLSNVSESPVSREPSIRESRELFAFAAAMQNRIR